MVGARWQSSIRWADRNTRTLWLVAVGLFGVYDVGTVVVGLPAVESLQAGAASTSPAGQPGVVTIIAAKAVVFGVCYGLWRVAPRPHANGVPLGLALLGVLTAAWDTVLLARAAGL